MRIFTPLFLALAALAVLLPVSAIAADPIVIYGNDAKAPKSWVDDGRPQGILVDILHEIETRTGLSFDIRLMPWKRAYMNALDGRGGIFGLSLNHERRTLFDFSEVMYVDEMRLVVVKGREFAYRTVEDLRGKIMGITRGASYGDGFDRAKGRIFIPSEDSSAICRLRMLLAGRIDVALIGPGRAALNFAVVQDAALAKQRDRFVVLDPPYVRDNNYIGFSKDMQQLETLDKINQALHAMHEDGTIQRIEGRY